jgi:hypothetical protein
MRTEQLEASQRVVQEVVRRWSRNRPWAAGLVPDLLQEALLAVLAAERNYVAARGAWEAYAAGAATNAVQRYAWRFRAAVSPPRPERGGRRADVVGGDAGRQALVLLTCEDPTPEEAAAKARAALKVRRAARALDNSPGKVGLAVLLGEAPSEVARRRRVDVRDVYAARKNLARRAAGSAEMRVLSEEMR